MNSRNSFDRGNKEHSRLEPNALEMRRDMDGGREEAKTLSATKRVSFWSECASKSGEARLASLAGKEGCGPWLI